MITKIRSAWWQISFSSDVRNRYRSVSRNDGSREIFIRSSSPRISYTNGNPRRRAEFAVARPFTWKLDACSSCALWRIACWTT